MTNPFRPMTAREAAAFEKAILAARDKAGSWRALAEILSDLAGDRSITYTAVRNWHGEQRIPAQWALLMDAYCEETDFLALCPYLKTWARRAA